MKFWLKAKWNLVLQLMGLRVSDEWLLLQAIIKEYGEEVGEILLAEAILLELRFGAKKASVQKIREEVRKGIK